MSSGNAYLSNDLIKSKNYELVKKLRVPSARNDLCGGEGAGGRRLPVLLTGPVCLSNNEAELSYAVLGLPLLDIGPSDLERRR